MGELPVFTCQAHVFTINPSTRKSWVPASSKAIDINFFYDSNKQFYRIVSVEDSSTGKRVVINSTITEKMVFKQTSQKFGQWADVKSSGVFGLGFNSESDLAKFIAQFKQCVEATKQTNSDAIKRNGKTQTDSLQPSTLKNGQPIVNVGDTVVSDATHNSFPFNTPISLLSPLNNAKSSASASGCDSSPGCQQQTQYHRAQANIQRLEQDLLAAKCQAAAFTEHNVPSSPIKVGQFDAGSTDFRDGFDRMLHVGDSASSLSTGGTLGTSTNSSSLLKPILMPSRNGGKLECIDVVPDLTSSGDISVSNLMKLHNQLGGILKEALDLHMQIGHLLRQTH